MDIYVSYSNESKEHVEQITQLISKLTSKGYNVISSIDGSFVKPFESISEAEKQFRDVNNILIFVSDRYMRANPHCLYELHFILMGAKAKNIMPIRLSNSKFLDKGESIYVKESINMLHNLYNIQYVEKKRLEIIQDKMYSINSTQFNPEEGYDNTHCPTPNDIVSFFKELYNDPLKMRIEEGEIDKAINAIAGKLGLSSKSDAKKSGDINPYIVDKYKSCYIELNKGKNILLVGDFILSQKNGKDLGECMENELLSFINGKHGDKYKTLAEWYNEKHDLEKEMTEVREYAKTKYLEIVDEKIGDANVDGTINKTNVDTDINGEKLRTLLNTNKFDIIFSLSYSWKIYEIVKEYAENKHLIFEHKVLVDNILKKVVLEDKKDDDSENELNVIESCQKKDEEIFSSVKEQYDKIILYDLVRISSEKIDDIYISELDIVEFVHSCITAIADSKKKNEIEKYRFFLTLGTNFPSWALRFIWYSFVVQTAKDNSTNASILNNSYVSNLIYTDKMKSKMKRLLEDNNSFYIEPKDTAIFVEGLRKFVGEENKKNNKTNVYISYDDSDADVFFGKVVPELKKEYDKDMSIAFFWRKRHTNVTNYKDSFEKQIKQNKIKHIIYFVTEKNGKLRSTELIAEVEKFVLFYGNLANCKIPSNVCKKRYEWRIKAKVTPINTIKDEI